MEKDNTGAEQESTLSARNAFKKIMNDEVFKDRCRHNYMCRSGSNINTFKYIVKNGRILFQCMLCDEICDLNNLNKLSGMKDLTQCCVNEAKQKYSDLVSSDEALSYTELDLRDKLDFYLSVFDLYSFEAYTPAKEEIAYELAIDMINDRINISKGIKSKPSKLRDTYTRNMDDYRNDYILVLAQLLVCGALIQMEHDPKDYIANALKSNLDGLAKYGYTRNDMLDIGALDRLIKVGCIANLELLYALHPDNTCEPANDIADLSGFIRDKKGRLGHRISCTDKLIIAAAKLNKCSNI